MRRARPPVKNRADKFICLRRRLHINTKNENHTNNSYTPDKPEQRELNILQLIHSGSNYSRLDIARKTGLSPAAITTIVRSLIGKGLVTEAEPVSSLVG